MDKARYVVGVLVVIAVAPGMVWWFFLHPFVNFWRKVGAGATLSRNASGVSCSQTSNTSHPTRLACASSRTVLMMSTAATTSASVISR